MEERAGSVTLHLVQGSGPVSEAGRAVLTMLLRDGALSRAELSRRLSLSQAHVTRIVRPLVDSGCVLEEAAAPVAGVAGRPSRPLVVRPDFAWFAGVKLTGSHVYLAVTDLLGRLLLSREEPLEQTAVDRVVEQIARMVEGVRNERPDVVGLGVSLSGNASRGEAVVRKSPFLHWFDVPLARLLKERTGLTTTLENDVRALTSAEQWFGDMVGVGTFALLTFGAGIGCGLVVDGRQVEGRLGASGLIGHLPITADGPRCYAGHIGCAHAYATSGSITRSVAARTGRAAITIEECVALREAGDPVAVEVFNAAGYAIGQLIATVVDIFGPEQVLVSGEGARFFELGEQAARARMRELLHWTAEAPVILVRPFDFSEWARGAAVVAIERWVADFGAATQVAVDSESAGELERG